MAARRRNDLLVGTGEAAEILSEAGYRVSGKTVARMCDQGVIPYKRIPGGNRRIRRVDLEAFLESLKTPS